MVGARRMDFKAFAAEKGLITEEGLLDLGELRKRGGDLMPLIEEYAEYCLAEGNRGAAVSEYLA